MPKRRMNFELYRSLNTFLTDFKNLLIASSSGNCLERAIQNRIFA